MTNLDAQFSTFQTWMKAHHPDAENIKPIHSVDDVLVLEQRLNVEFPASLRKLLCWQCDPLIENMRILDLEEIEELTVEMTNMKNVGEWDDDDHWHLGWIPILENGGGDYLIFDNVGSFGGSPGQLLNFDHEGSFKKEIIAPNFDIWLDAFVSSLQAGGFVIEDDFVASTGRMFQRKIGEIASGYPKTVDLTPDEGEVSVRFGGKGKKPILFIDDKEIGKLHQKMMLTAGVHKFRVVYVDGNEEECSLYIRKGNKRRIEFPLKK